MRNPYLDLTPTRLNFLFVQFGEKMFYLESWSQIFPNPGGLKWENTTEGKLTFLTFWWRWWWLFQGLWWEFQGFLWWFQSMKMRQWPEWSRSSPCSWKWTHWFPHQPFFKCNLSNFKKYDSLQVRFVRSTPTCPLPAQNKRWGTWEHGNDQLEDDCDDEGLLRKDENGDGHGYDADD